MSVAIINLFPAEDTLAGEAPAAETLPAPLALAVEAWEAHPDPRVAGPRISYVLGRLKEDLSFQAHNLVDPDANPRMVRGLLEMAVREGLIEGSRESICGMAGGVSGHYTVETHHGGATPIRQPPTRPTIAELSRKQQAAGAARLAMEVSFLDSLLSINGKPLSRCTVAEARAWANEEGTRAARRATGLLYAVRKLTSGLGGNVVLGDVWKNEQDIKDILSRSYAEAKDVIDA